MDRTTTQYLLQTMIEYFESGNNETDATAKAILESDCEHQEHWQINIARIKKGKEWTGVRAPEAEIVASTLRHIQQNVFGDS